MHSLLLGGIWLLVIHLYCTCDDLDLCLYALQPSPMFRTSILNSRSKRRNSHLLLLSLSYLKSNHMQIDLGNPFCEICNLISHLVISLNFHSVQLRVFILTDDNRISFEPTNKDTSLLARLVLCRIMVSLFPGMLM